MELPSYFIDFLSEIRLTPTQVEDLINGHETLRELLRKDEKLSDIIVVTFLQGSYRRSTIIKPKDNENPDVDIVVVTNLDKELCTPEDAHNKFIPFLEENYYNKYQIQGRSIGICLDSVDLDLVITTAPSESQKEILKNYEIISNVNIEDIENEITIKSFNSKYRNAIKTKEFFGKLEDSPKWKDEPLYIPDREANDWKPTHPLEQIRWTIEKNDNTNKHYVNVVKALKWWRKEKYANFKHPKSYSLEHFIGECCPDDVASVAEGVTLTLENMKSHFTKPYLPDHGVPEHDVFGRITDEEYSEFHLHVSDAADIAREAMDSDDKNHSISKWKELFGNEFDPYRKDKNNRNGNGGNKKREYTKRTEKSKGIPGRRFG